MGCGKSFLGRQLSAFLNWSFIDLDQQIELSIGKSVTDIFHENGEDFFRVEETKQLKSTIEHSNTVISTGGGAPCFNDNLNWIKKNGKSVYLKVSPSILLGRLRDDRIQRPLVSGMSIEELTDFIKTEMIIREPFYKKADQVLDADIFSASLLKSIVELCEVDADTSA